MKRSNILSNYLVFGGNGQIASGFINKYVKEGDFCLIIDKHISVETELSLSSNKVDYFFLGIDINSCNQEKIVAFLEEKKITIDYVLFAIGINPMNNFFSSTIKSFELTINTNFTSLFKCLKLIFNYLNTVCSIVIIASQNGVVGHEDRICYGPSKAALIQLVKNLSIDFSKYSSKDVKINSISPGYVISDRNRDFFNSTKGQKMINKSPYKKIPSIENVIDCIEFLFSKKSEAIRGQNLVVDYGYTII